MNDDKATAAPKLAVLPDPAPETEESETPAPQGYTLADQFERNAQLIRDTADRLGIDPAALVNLFTTTMNVHFTKIQLGLAAPVEG